MRNDAHLWPQPNRKLWLGPAYVERKREAAPRCEPTNSLDADVRATGAALGELKRLVRSLRLELALRRHRAALRHVGKAGFNPDQPRDWHGRWTDAGGSSSSDGRIRLAGDIPTGDSPELPKERPPTSEARVAAYKVAARWLTRFGGPIGKLIEGAEWLRQQSPLIQSYNDPPGSLQELQEAVSTPAAGYDIHHIVRQDQEGHFPRELIDSPENKVRIPRMKHWEINGWYQRENPDYGWQTPKDYIDGRNWDVQRAVGLEALRFHGVLK